LWRLSLHELLDFAYYYLVKDTDADGRRRVDLYIAGRLGESGGEIVDDPDLPEALQGKEAPSWWRADDDPFADQHDLSGTDTSLHSG
jgi:hypothetical protein